jgi:hypothetical protein
LTSSYGLILSECGGTLISATVDEESSLSAEG